MYAGADDFGELGEEIGKGGCEFITTEESTVVTELMFDAMVVKDSEGNGCFSDPPCANESNRFEILGESDDLLDQCVAPEKGLWCLRR